MDYLKDCSEKIFDVVVIGAGFSGAYVAGQLAERGSRVAIVDKARGTGGRLSSKRLAWNTEHIGFDLGAQSFEVTHPSFLSYLKARDDVVIDKLPGGKHAYVTPRNSSFARGALGGAAPYFGARVTNARFKEGVWQVTIENADGEILLKALSCVLAAPPKQAAQILGQEHHLYKQLDAVEHEAQWVMMLAVKQHSVLGNALRALSEASQLSSALIASVSCDSDKQGRSAPTGIETFVIHARPDWTMKHVDLDPDLLAERVFGELENIVGEPQKALEECVVKHHVHRWLYARPQAACRIGASHINDAAESLLICGDYFTVESEFGVESAFLSAQSLLSV